MATVVSGNEFNSAFPPLGLHYTTSASKLGLSKPVVPTLLQRDSNSLSKVNLIDVLEAFTIPNNDHLEVQATDSPTVKQIKDLSAEVMSLRNELDTKNKLLDSLKDRGNQSVGGLGLGISWKDKVSPPSEACPRMNLQFFPPEVEGETVRVSPPKHVELQGSEKWRDCIVGHFVDRKLPFKLVRSIAFNNWRDYGLKDVLANDKGFFFFVFGVEGAYRQISEIGAWHFAGRLMVLQEWHSEMDYENEGLNKLPLWIQLYNVPLQYWTEAGLSYLASAVGKPLYADAMTESTSRISYAKICVEVDAQSPLPHSIDLTTSTGRMVKVGVKYPWRPLRCVACNIFGHSECSKLVKPPIQLEATHKAQDSIQNKVWVVKGNRSEGVPNTILDTSGDLVAPKESVVNVPCSNQFLSLQAEDNMIDDAAESDKGMVSSPCGDENKLTSPAPTLPEPRPCINQEGSAAFDFLPDLDVGLQDPDVVFQALSVLEGESSKKACKGENLGVGKRRKKTKRKW